MPSIKYPTLCLNMKMKIWCIFTSKYFHLSVCPLFKLLWFRSKSIREKWNQISSFVWFINQKSLFATFDFLKTLPKLWYFLPNVWSFKDFFPELWYFLIYSAQFFYLEKISWIVIFSAQSILPLPELAFIICSGLVKGREVLFTGQKLHLSFQIQKYKNMRK